MTPATTAERPSTSASKITFARAVELHHTNLYDALLNSATRHATNLRIAPEDLLNETICSLLKTNKEIGNTAQDYRKLVSLAIRHRAKDIYVSETRRYAVNHGVDDATMDSAADPRSTSPDERVVREELYSIVQRALDRLTPCQRKFLTSWLTTEGTNTEIAIRNNTSAENVGQTLKRAFATLATLIPQSYAEGIGAGR